MNGLDWTSYAFQLPPPTLLCQFRREGQGQAGWFVGYAKDFSPEFNVANLEWRLTGIARVQLDQMPPEIRAQVMALTPPWMNRMMTSQEGALGAM